MRQPADRLALLQRWADTLQCFAEGYEACSPAVQAEFAPLLAEHLLAFQHARASRPEGGMDDAAV